MKCLFYIVVLMWIGESLSEVELCAPSDTTKAECNFTDYDLYVECMRKRVKREACVESVVTNGEDSFSSSGPDESCSECDCNNCNQNHCNTPCSNCCTYVKTPCKSRTCCYKNCHAQCTTTHCRRSCKKSCTAATVTNGNNPEHTVTKAQLHNSTTVINLRNIINTTNVINVPVYVNNSNFNNITVEAQGRSDSFVWSNNSNDCCKVVSPRQCVPNNQFPFIKCFHYRKQICGDICQSRIMHAQPHQVCDERPSGPPECHKQIIYIPQPQPRCVSKTTWPYLSCAIKQFCDGCYSQQNPSYCPAPCYGGVNNAGLFHPPGPWTSSVSGSSSFGAGFIPSGRGLPAYPALLGLPEDHFSIESLGLPENSDVQEGSVFPSNSGYLKKSESGEHPVEAELLPDNPVAAPSQSTQPLVSRQRR